MCENLKFSGKNEQTRYCKSIEYFWVKKLYFLKKNYCKNKKRSGYNECFN